MPHRIEEMVQEMLILFLLKVIKYKNGEKIMTATIIKYEDRPNFDRGDGVSTTLLYGKDNAEGTIFTSGFTTFPTGRAAPMHSHNCCEQVLIISGNAEVECGGIKTEINSNG